MTTIKDTLTIQNQLGLHARAAAKFVQTAMRYAAEVTLAHKEQTVNGKSIMGVMMLAASKGTLLYVTAEGDDAQEAFEALKSLVDAKFYEE